MSYSRAVLLLEREMYRLGQDPVWGMETSIIRNNIWEWSVTLKGLEDTPWEGGVFQLELYFNENFDSEPPAVFFLTIPFHPNVDMQTGRPCADFLDDIDCWQPMSISSILLHIQYLLANPCLDNPVNTSAAEIYLNSPRLYNQLVRDCVVASRRIESGLNPFDETQPLDSDANDFTSGQEDTSAQTNVPYSANKPYKVRRIAFDDYYETWTKTATSVPMNHNVKVFDMKKMMLAQPSRKFKVSEAMISRIVDKQRELWYGRFQFRNQKEKKSPRDEKRDKINALRKLYNLPTTKPHRDTFEEEGFSLDDFNSASHGSYNKSTHKHHLPERFPTPSTPGIASPPPSENSDFVPNTDSFSETSETRTEGIRLIPRFSSANHFREEMRTMRRRSSSVNEAQEVSHARRPSHARYSVDYSNMEHLSHHRPSMKIGALEDVEAEEVIQNLMEHRASLVPVEFHTFHQAAAQDRRRSEQFQRRRSSSDNFQHLKRLEHPFMTTTDVVREESPEAPTTTTTTTATATATATAKDIAKRGSLDVTDGFNLQQIRRQSENVVCARTFEEELDRIVQQVIQTGNKAKTKRPSVIENLTPLPEDSDTTGNTNQSTHKNSIKIPVPDNKVPPNLPKKQSSQTWPRVGPGSNLKTHVTVEASGDDEDWEQDADDLLNWTKTLDSKLI